MVPQSNDDVTSLGELLQTRNDVSLENNIRSYLVKDNLLPVNKQYKMVVKHYWWFSLSRNKKIKSKPFNDRSYELQILLKRNR